MMSIVPLYVIVARGVEITQPEKSSRTESTTGSVSEFVGVSGLRAGTHRAPGRSPRSTAVDGKGAKSELLTEAPWTIAFTSAVSTWARESAWALLKTDC